MLTHPIPPVFNSDSKILILGSFPSVRSRQEQFYYGHPQNRFWRVLAALLNCDVPLQISDKRNMLLENGIALWDIISSCDINGSSDCSIKNVIPNDLKIITSASQIRTVFTNGGTANRLYCQFGYKQTLIEATLLPSTSPANATYSLQRLIACWSVLLDTLNSL